VVNLEKGRLKLWLQNNVQLPWTAAANVEVEDEGQTNPEETDAEREKLAGP